MIINLVVIFLILIIGKFYSNGSFIKINSDSNRKKYIRLICLILILQSGLRNVAVGADTYQYFSLFEAVKKTSWSEIYQSLTDYYKLGLGKDPGYLVFQKITQVVTGEYQIFLFVIAILFFAALGTFIYKNTTRLSDAIMAFIIYSVLFYSFFSITGHRQTIATAAALYGFEFIKKRKLVPFVLLILLASTIHKSCLIFIPFYFICQLNKTKLIYVGALLLFLVFMEFRNSMALYFQSIGGYEEYEQFEGAGTFTFTAMFLLISIIALIRNKSILKHNIQAQYYYNAFAVGLLFIPLTWINPSMMRVVQYFSIFMLLLIPEIINSFGDYSLKLKKDMTVVVIIFLIALMIKANANAAPYGFFWEEMRLGKNY
jgi:transmembrane protein EpsG